MTEQMSVPKLRFSEFNKECEYTQYKFDDIFIFSSGKNIKQNEASPEFITPCVRYGELYHMYGEVITKTINSTNLDKSDLTFSHGNEILLPSAGEDPLDIGSASALILKGVAIGRTINVLRPKGDIDYSHVYVSYYINNKLRRDISKLARGASISNVYNSDLKTLKVNLPELDEQQKIASFLTSVDSKISQLTEKHRLLKEYKKGVMQQIFSQQLRFKDKDGKAFPEWEYKKGNKLFKAVSNKKHNSDLPILAITQNQGAIPRELINYEVQVTDNSVAGYKVVEKGDFIISLRSFQGGIEFSNYKGICSPAYIILQPNVVIDNVFYQRYLKTHNFIQEMKKRLEGIRDGKILSYKYFSEIELPFPSIKEQQKIAQFLQSIDKKIDVVAQQVEQTKQFKKGLLQQMFV